MINNWQGNNAKDNSAIFLTRVNYRAFCKKAANKAVFIKTQQNRLVQIGCTLLQVFNDRLKFMKNKSMQFAEVV